MTLENLMSRLDDELTRAGAAVDVQSFISIFYPNDIEAGQLLSGRSVRDSCAAGFTPTFLSSRGISARLPTIPAPVWH